MPVTLDQRHVALERANAVRFEIARLHRELAAREISLLDALEDPAVENVWVSKVLGWQRGYGRDKSLNLCNRFAISPARRCGQLTVRQRMILSEFA